MSNQQKDTSRSDTTAPAGAQPVQGRSGKVGSQVAGQGGGTDAAAGASMGGDFGQGQRRQDPDAVGSPGSPGGSLGGDALSPGAGAAVAGGTGLGEANSADDTRVGTSSGEGASLTGGDASSGDIPPPTRKGGASAA
jgi:hypothetical protein